MNIIVDTMGNDHGPKEVVRGSIDAMKEYDINLILVGDLDQINEELSELDYNKDKLEIIESSQVIENDEDPAIAIRRKKDSSMVLAAKALSEGRGDGMISSGSTGALLASGLFIVKRIEGIDRAALSVLYPTLSGFSLLVDGGANVDCKPEYLLQFAEMGSIYMSQVIGKDNPTVGIINIGSEEGKGNSLTKDAYKLLGASDLNFIGNVEARDLPKGQVDILVCDGFVGNIALKLTEGMAISILSMLKDEFSKNMRTKFAASLLMKELKGLKAHMDYREYGGAPLLGTKKPIVKAHGSSDAFAIKNGIGQLVRFVQKDVINIIEKNISWILWRNGNDFRKSKRNCSSSV